MNIEISALDGNVTIALTGKLNTITASEFGKALGGALKDAKELILDFAGLEYISSAGLRVILEAYQIMTAQGSMKIINVNDEIMEIFSMTGFLSFLEIE